MLRVLVLAEDCNPKWPSLPIVGYKYARALGQVVDMTLVTHIRNQENIEKAGDINGRVCYIDTEWLAAPLYKLAVKLRGGSEVAWSTNQIMAYPPYIAFERQTWSQFKKQLQSDEFDVVHRITPMSPTLPSWMAGKSKTPFVIGPLNGNLDWPHQFTEELKREKEGLRKLRPLYKMLPFTRRTYKKSTAIIASFSHTKKDLTLADPDRIISMPEIGYDPTLFHRKGRDKPFSKMSEKKRFLYVGRLVPYKLPEVAVKAFIGSEILQQHQLHIVGRGPELERLKEMVADAKAEHCVSFEGEQTQDEVADFMRQCDAFVFPSIRELGAGVVIEAMASGLPCIVVNYGAPGDLAADGRGINIPIADRAKLTLDFKDAMEQCVLGAIDTEGMADKAASYAESKYDWDRKAQYTQKIYKTIINKEPLAKLTMY